MFASHGLVLVPGPWLSHICFLDDVPLSHHQGMIMVPTHGAGFSEFIREKNWPHKVAYGAQRGSMSILSVGWLVDYNYVTLSRFHLLEGQLTGWDGLTQGWCGHSPADALLICPTESSMDVTSCRCFKGRPNSPITSFSSITATST